MRAHATFEVVGADLVELRKLARETAEAFLQREVVDAELPLEARPAASGSFGEDIPSLWEAEVTLVDEGPR